MNVKEKEFNSKALYIQGRSKLELFFFLVLAFMQSTESKVSEICTKQKGGKREVKLIIRIYYVCNRVTRNPSLSQGKKKGES